MEAVHGAGEVFLVGSSRARAIRRWGRSRRMPDADAARAVQWWRRALGVRQRVRLERVDPFQVTDERRVPGCSLVGVCHDSESACIYHTRALTAEDIVHELLHVREPDWSEDRVAAGTTRLLAGGARAKRSENACVEEAEGSAARQPVSAGRITCGQPLRAEQVG
jgi:hypothetical protein